METEPTVLEPGQDEGKMLTIPQAAAILGCSRQHVYRLMHAGVIPFVDLSIPGSNRSYTRISEVELRHWIRENTIVADSE